MEKDITNTGSAAGADSPPSPCSTLVDDCIHNAAKIIIAGFAANGRRNEEWIKEAARIIRTEVQPWLSRWVAADARTPKDGEWVLHTYAGVRKPEYGLFKDGRFWREAGPESFPTTHWLSVPMIDLSNKLLTDSHAK
jgi:hypothetical protein